MGVYELVAALGAGGMGEVYRARDTRLGRDVALKVLSADLASSGSLARFEEEARHVAALNHPNIVALFDIGTAHGMAYIVTELVDGVTLRGASFPVRKVADIGAQIADALAAAHGTGVTHRDIKPDNVMVTRAGRVKVLDFGVAKVTGPIAADGMTVAQTRIGSIVGTAGYMAPEQVRGDAVDPRADIFAVGAVLYELLAQMPAFKGATAAEIMTATLRVDPPELPSEVPNAFRQIVGRCLEKNPEERFQSARDLAFALRQLTGSSVTAADTVRVEARRFQSRAWIAGAGVLLGVLVTGLTAQRWAAVQDATLDPIQLTRVTADRRNELAPALSPDGRSLAYLRVGGILTELLVRPLDSVDPIRLAASNTALAAPVWSSDGNQICYTDVARELFCVGAAGGLPRRILGNVFRPRIAPDGSTIVFIRALKTKPWLFRGTLAGSEPQPIGDVPLPSDVSVLSPVSPDGSTVIVAANSGRWLISLSDGTRRELMSEEGVRTRSIAWLPDSRHIVAAEEATTLIGSRLSVQDTHSAARRLILRTADQIDAIAASSDGARIVYPPDQSKGTWWSIQPRARSSAPSRLLPCSRAFPLGRRRVTGSCTGLAALASPTASGLAHATAHRPRWCSDSCPMLRRRRAFRRTVDGLRTRIQPGFTSSPHPGAVQFASCRRRASETACAGHLTANGSGIGGTGAAWKSTERRR